MQFMQKTAYGSLCLQINQKPAVSSAWPLTGFRLPVQMMRIMRLLFFFLFIGFLSAHATGKAQSVTISGRDMPVKQVFAAIEKQTGYVVFSKKGLLPESKLVSLSVSNMPLSDLLKEVLKDETIDFVIQGKTIILSQRPGSDATAAPRRELSAFVDITGRVLNAETKEAVTAASVIIKRSGFGTITDQAGFFNMRGVAPDAVLVISSVGFRNIEVPVASFEKMRSGIRMLLRATSGTEAGYVEKNENGQFLIYIQPAKVILNEVVINTGMYTRSKESFTGAASVYTGAQLKTIGNRNILQSLKSLDPAFIEVQNNLQGSNPNRLPNFEIRGRTGVSTLNLNDQFNSDPNQPLFILDGFESTLQAIYDLDINRVATVTILKDAASTALYGAKAANGVVVVETKRPVPGELRVSYSGDFGLDMPDLSSYNLMNSSEKLEFERLSGVYIPQGLFPRENEDKYNYRLREVQRGVNTYWLGEPLQVGFTNRHSAQISGGNNELMFNAGIQYGSQPGVMKGSSRDSWGANVGLTYRKGKINISNLLSLSGYTGTESPYGNFSVYASANPYYRKYNDDGTIRKYLDSLYDPKVLNPLYDAQLYNKNESKGFNVSNNLQAIYNISNKWRVQAGLMVGKGNVTSILFIPPDHSSFQTAATNQKGRYANSRQEKTSYSGNVALTYATVIGKSQLTGMVRGEIREDYASTVGFTAVGFPNGTDGSPSFAMGFIPYGRPNSQVQKVRSVGALASVNYSYDQRFLIDGVYRLDGASVFGSERLFKPFVSGGVGWNIHREAFMKNVGWISLLKLRGNMGFTGNENLGQFSSVSLYNFNTSFSNNFGQGLTLASLGNPSLDWQQTFQESYGFDFAFLENRVSGSLEYFKKKTDPLAVGAAGTQATSAGVNQNYVINVGYLTTRGWNVNLRVSPVYDMKNRIIWTVGIMGSNNTSTYGGFAEKLAELNKQEQGNRTLNRYYDGYSPDDMWAVQSHGIDPATGMEVFQKKDGTLTFDYDPADIVRVGNSRPKVEGNINTTFTYKAFSLGAVIRYRLKGYVMNNALYQKVENTGLYSLNIKGNQDRRALYERWQKPGDIAMFKGIANTASSPMSSRFIQEDSHFAGESFNLSWRTTSSWIKAAGMRSLSLNFYMNDIFRLESILSERGIEYPYARTLSFSVNASF